MKTDMIYYDLAWAHSTIEDVVDGKPIRCPSNRLRVHPDGGLECLDCNNPLPCRSVRVSPDFLAGLQFRVACAKNRLLELGQKPIRFELAESEYHTYLALTGQTGHPEPKYQGRPVVLAAGSSAVYGETAGVPLEDPTP